MQTIFPKLTGPSLLLVTLLASPLLQSCSLPYRNLQQPTVALVTIQPQSMNSDMSLRLATQLRLSNPNDVDLAVKGADLLIKLNGQEIASTQLTENFVIAANGDTDIDVPVDIDLMTAVNLGLSALGQREAVINWQLLGHIDMGVAYLGRVRINEQGALNLGQLMPHDRQGL